MNNNDNYINKANAPLLEGMTSNIKQTHSHTYILIYLNFSTEVF